MVEHHPHACNWWCVRCLGWHRQPWLATAIRKSAGEGMAWPELAQCSFLEGDCCGTHSHSFQKFLFTFKTSRRSYSVVEIGYPPVSNLGFEISGA